MEKKSQENVYLIDLMYASSPADIVFELSSVIEQNQTHNQDVFLKLGKVDLNQSQLLSIKSLISSINSKLIYISSPSRQTETAALTIGVDVVPQPQEDDGKPSVQYVPLTEHLDAEEPVQVSLNLENKVDEAAADSVRTEIDEIEANIDAKLEAVLEDDTDEPSEVESKTGFQFEPELEEFPDTFKTVEKAEEKEIGEGPLNLSSQEITVETVQDDNQIQDTLDSIFDTEIKLENILGEEQEQQDDVEEETSIEIPEEEELTDEDYAIRAMPTRYLKQIVRSGQVIKHDGNFVIIGDCHPGSEIYARGDITVWGTLGGIAHAGYKGNNKARIRALQLNAIQLRIGESFARKPDMVNTLFVDKSNTVTPEEARIIDGSIVILKLNDKI